ncbi:MAG: hypothetical protein ACR2OC_06845 [Solirubrobacterales bacterium]
MATREAGPAAVSALEMSRSVARKHAPGAYLGAADGNARHRISFTLDGDRVRNVRIDGHLVAPEAPLGDGRLQIRHLGFELIATWLDADNVEGRVRMRGKWNRPEAFRFSAHHRIGNVLSGR